MEAPTQPPLILAISQASRSILRNGMGSGVGVARGGNSFLKSLFIQQL